jgi:hypothetical protein
MTMMLVGCIVDDTARIASVVIEEDAACLCSDCSVELDFVAEVVVFSIFLLVDAVDNITGKFDEFLVGTFCWDRVRGSSVAVSDCYACRVRVA